MTDGRAPLWQRDTSVRFRLLVIALLPILVLMPVLIGVTMQRWIARTDQILLTRVTSDLVVAHQYLAHLIDSTGQNVAVFGETAEMPEGAARAGWLEENRERLGLDFLWLADGADSPASSGIEVLSPAELAALSPALAERAKITLDPPTGVERRGLVILASSPLRGGGGRIVGGILLNHNADFIDGISALVYPVSDPGVARRVDGPLDHGVISLFLDDIRISTTARAANGARAIGTRAAAPVRERVLVEGETWNDTAFVVNDWYLSAYEPIRDSRGNRVGMLYAGIPEAPYRQARRITWTIIIGVFTALTLVSVPLFLHWARGIFRPLEAMGRTIGHVDAGDMGARTGAVQGAEEITRLSQHLDQLLDRLQARERDLRELNADLNTRVEERTADLTRSNLALEAASRQLVLSEKLATIGEVTAGVAHEINNPLAVMQGNLEILRMIVAEAGSDATVELTLIDEQIRRISALVGQLLQFARPEEFADGRAAGTDPQAAVAGIRPLIRHLLDRSGVTLETDLRSGRVLRINRHELQQILVNLTVNAIQAMPSGGVIRIACRDEAAPDGRPGVLFTVGDTGTGMDAATLSRIFDPFFTTRGSAGTGLGLPICQAIVARQEGQIRAESTPGEGTRFFIWLPAADAPAS